MYVIQHCFICRLSDSAVSEDAEIEPRNVATLASTARRSYHLARSHPKAQNYMEFQYFYWTRGVPGRLYLGWWTERREEVGREAGRYFCLCWLLGGGVGVF
jgi:hypothetical protein